MSNNTTDKLFLGAQKPIRKDICIELPPQVNSNGYWSDKNDKNPEGLLKNSLPELELQMITIFCVSQTFHFILKRFGVSRIASEILTGLLIGYVLSDQNGNPINDKLLTPAGQHILGTVSIFGYSLFLFLTAVKMNVGMVTKTGSKAATIGIVALMVPFTLGMFTHKIVSNVNGLNPVDQKRIPFIFITQSLVYFPVIYTLVTELNILNSELGRLALSAGMVADLLSFFLGNVFLLIKVFTESTRRAVIDVAARAAYFVAVVFVFRPLMVMIVKRTPEGRPVRDVYIYTIIVVALSTALYSNYFDEQIFSGPYMLGLAVPVGPPLGSAIVGKLDCFVSGVFLPLFVATSVLRVDFTKDKFDGLVKADIVMVSVIQIAKLAACVTTCMFYDMPRHDSLVLSFIMSSKGIVDIALYTYWRDANNLDESSYNVLIYATLVISVVVSVSVKVLYDPTRKYAGYQKRNIMHMKPNSELRVLTCIHKAEDIAATIDLLDAACPTKESPIGVYVLHLIELVGRATPVFVSHQVQKSTLSTVSYSQNVILSFNRFENNNWGSVKVSAFTAVSPYKLMHEDICTLALDKLTSLVVLPFHRKWSSDGSVEAEDNLVRSLNCAVLDRSPCSVAILVSRGFSARAAAGAAVAGGGGGGGGGGGSAASLEAYMYSVCMVFLGGADDREALALAKRMASRDQSSGVSLTVVRFAAAAEEVTAAAGEWETVMDAEALKDLKHGGGSSARRRVAYIEEVVGDGSETAPAVRAMVDDYDLVIVGRSHAAGCRQLAGLDLAWAEFPELGVLGDLLASKDIYGKASVLVVKQQATD